MKTVPTVGADHPSVRRLRSLFHNTYIGINGGH